MGFFKNLFQKKQSLTYKKAFEKGALSLQSVSDTFHLHHTLNHQVLETLETSFLSADVGVGATEFIIDKMIKMHSLHPIATYDMLLDAMAEIMDEIIEIKTLDVSKPVVFLMVGVNGVGKTTTIGKLAHAYKAHHPLIIAADTFRAAAIDQLEVWANKNGVTCFKTVSKDPSSVIYDGMQYAIKHHHKVIMIDTAGRLQAKDALMAELQKMYRVLSKFDSSFHLETLLVLDATTGQNGLSQATAFKEIAHVSGIVITKMDGSAKGGIVLSVAKNLRIPMVFMGIGEDLEDLKPFDKEAYILGMLDQELLQWN